MEPTTMPDDKNEAQELAKIEAQELAKKYKKEENNEIITHDQSDHEEGAHGTPYDNNDPLNNDDTSIGNLMNCNSNNMEKLSWQKEDELIFKLEDALCHRKWDLAECLVMGSSMHVLNEALCLSFSSIWFFSTRGELNELTTLIKKIVSSGASDFYAAAIISSLLAALVTAWQSGTLRLERLETFVDQWFRLSREELNGNEVLRKKGVDMPLKFTGWAVMWFKEHQGSSNLPKMFTPPEIQLQLTTFRTFLDLAENRLTICDFAKALHGACTLIIHSCSFYPGWASDTSASALRGLLNILVQRGPNNLNYCILEASRHDCAEVVLMLLQVARLNNVAVDVEAALDLAATYSGLDTMNVLVDEGQAKYFTLPFVNAIIHGRISVVSWFVNRGCDDSHLLGGLACSAALNQHEVANCLLSKIPIEVLVHYRIQILKAATMVGHGSLDGVAFLLSSNVLGSYDAVYEFIDSTVNDEDENMLQLTAYIKNNWSESSFHEGVRVADDHYVDVMRVLRRGCSEVKLSDLPAEMVIAIALMPLYRECLKVKGVLLPCRLKGELVRSLQRFGCREAEAKSMKGELMTMLERLLPSYAVSK